MNKPKNELYMLRMLDALKWKDISDICSKINGMLDKMEMKREDKRRIRYQLSLIQNRIESVIGILR